MSKPWRHYRPRYSMTEVRWSAAVVAVLAAVGAWVAWRGAHPDPELFSASDSLLDPGSEWAPSERPVARAGGEGAQGGRSDRGPVPQGLAAPGWSESAVTYFARDNLYEKINGRIGYYEAFGVVGMHFASVVRDGSDTTLVDLELFDLGTPANALGAYAGERQEDAQTAIAWDSPPEGDDGDGEGGGGGATIRHRSRNALFLVRGQYYARAIGSDETEEVVAQLEHMAAALARALPGGDLPWAFALFAGQLGVDPGALGFNPTNAFSFGFARNVHTARINEDGAELFTAATETEAAAAALAGQFAEGFSSYGEKVTDPEADAATRGVVWIKDRYLGEVSGATHRGSLVVGIRGAPDLAFARRWLGKLAGAAAALPASVAERAAREAGAPEQAAGGGDEGGGGADDGGGEGGYDEGAGGHGEDEAGSGEGEAGAGDPGGAGEAYDLEGQEPLR